PPAYRPLAALSPEQEVFWEHVESGAFKPIVDSVYPLAEAEAAQARMTSMQHSGKIILEV
ncbi:MAG: zinc-binding dehydrogenase, partial [Pseudomonadota bacterium]